MLPLKLEKIFRLLLHPMLAWNLRLWGVDDRGVPGFKSSSQIMSLFQYFLTSDTKFFWIFITSDFRFGIQSSLIKSYDRRVWRHFRTWAADFTVVFMHVSSNKLLLGEGLNATAGQEPLCNFIPGSLSPFKSRLVEFVLDREVEKNSGLQSAYPNCPIKHRFASTL